MEGGWALLFIIFCLHTGRECLASLGHRQHEGDTEGDQVFDGSSLIPVIWDMAREGRHYGPVLPLARPRPRQESNEPELLFAVWESLPILAKEGLTEEEALWVPDAKPLQTIKDNYVFGSREFDHHFGLVPRPTVSHSSTTHPTPPPHEEVSTPETTPDLPAPAPHTDSPTSFSDDPAPHTPLHTMPFPPPYLRPFTYMLPQQRRPRKYFLAGGEEGKQKPEEPSRSGLFRKYHIAPASKDITQDAPNNTPGQKPSHPHLLPAFLPFAEPHHTHPRPHHTHPRPPPTVRKYFLQPQGDVTHPTSFEVYDKLRQSRAVEAEARAWVVSGVPKATSWVSFRQSPPSGHSQS